jgi:copper(I)-binding protein
MKTTLFASLLIASSLGLAGCDNAPAQSNAAAENGVAGLTVSNARMVLAPVAGNPAAVYFDLSYDGDGGTALSRVKVEDAKSATFHDYGEYDSKKQMMDMLPVPLNKGDKIEFKPGGKHVMAMEPSPALKAGGTAEVTIFVSGGKSQTFKAPIKAAGDDR